MPGGDSMMMRLAEGVFSTFSAATSNRCKGGPSDACYGERPHRAAVYAI